jgi:hypothetical protein
MRDFLTYLSVEISHYLFLILAGLYLALRFSNFIRREQFIYIFIGSFNFSLGIHAIVVYLLGYQLVAYPEIMSANLAIGLIMLIDALLLKRKPYEHPVHDR